MMSLLTLNLGGLEHKPLCPFRSFATCTYVFFSAACKTWTCKWNCPRKRSTSNSEILIYHHIDYTQTCGLLSVVEGRQSGAGEHYRLSGVKPRRQPMITAEPRTVAKLSLPSSVPMRRANNRSAELEFHSHVAFAAGHLQARAEVPRIRRRGLLRSVTRLNRRYCDLEVCRHAKIASVTFSKG